jgi:hypothetical protein
MCPSRGRNFCRESVDRDVKMEKSSGGKRANREYSPPRRGYEGTHIIRSWHRFRDADTGDASPEAKNIIICTQCDDTVTTDEAAEAAVDAAGGATADMTFTDVASQDSSPDAGSDASVVGGCTGAGLTKCGSSCTDMTSDASNCRACDHSCQGGACSGGHCQPVTLGTFSNSGQAPLLAINSSSAYVGISGNPNLIEKCPLTGCSTGASLVTTLSFSQFGFAPSVQASDSGVFWVGSDGSVGGYVNGAKITYLPAYAGSSTPYGRFIVVDSSNVYWSTDSSQFGVMSCPIGGCTGSPSTLETGSLPTWITVASGYLYWSDGNHPSKLMKCQVAGGGCGTSPTPLGTSAASLEWYVRTADSSNVYFTENSGSSGTTRILQCAVTGCPPGPPGPTSAPMRSLAAHQPASLRSTPKASTG